MGKITKRQIDVAGAVWHVYIVLHTNVHNICEIYARHRYMLLMCLHVQNMQSTHFCRPCYVLWGLTDFRLYLCAVIVLHYCAYHVL